jgi:hypothetical protein
MAENGADNRAKLADALGRWAAGKDDAAKAAAAAVLKAITDELEAEQAGALPARLGRLEAKLDQLLNPPEPEPEPLRRSKLSPKQESDYIRVHSLAQYQALDW